MAAGQGNIKIIESDSDNESESEEIEVVQRTEDRGDEINDEEHLYEEVVVSTTRQQGNTSAAQHDNTIEKTIKCKTKHHCLLMKMASIESNVSNLSVSFREETCSIVLRGPKELVLEHNLEYLQRLNNVCTLSEPVSANRLHVLKQEGCMEKLRQRGQTASQIFRVFIENQNLTDPAVHCLAFSEKDAKEALQNTLDCFRKLNVPFAPHNVELFTSETWDVETQALQKSLMVVIEIVHTESVVEVEGLTEDVQKAADKLRGVLNAHKPIRTIILSGAKARLMCKTSSLKEELTRLKEEVKQNPETVDITETHSDCEDTLTIKFTDDHTLRTRIQTITEKIKDIKLTFADFNKNDQGIITRCLNSKKGKREIRNLEEKYATFIDIVDSEKKVEVRYIEDNSTGPSPVARSKSLSNLLEEKSLTVGATELQVKDGSVVKEKASVLVNVLRKSSMWRYGMLPRLFSLASRQLKKDFEEEYDEIENVVLTKSSGQLTHLCKFVCNIVLEDWNRENSKSHEQSLREVIKKCLSHCEDNQLDSIAFPAVGTGKLLKFPDNMVAKIMVEECVTWSKGRTRLKKIVFVIYDSGERQEFDEELERFHRIVSKKSKLQRLGTLLPHMFRMRGSPTSLQEGKEDESVKHVSLFLPDLLLSGENSQGLKDLRKKINEEVERLFLSKEIIQNKGLIDKITREDKQDIFEAVRTMDVILKIDSDKYVIMGHRDDVQALANKTRALLLDSFSAEPVETTSQSRPKRWMGPRSKKGTEGYWREVLEHQKTPLYWKEFRGGYDIKYYLKQKKDFCRVNMVDSDTFKAISEMVEQTWDQAHVGHGADAKGLGHQGIKVTKIERVESIELFSHYSQQRERIIRQMLRSGLNSYPRIETVTQKGGILTTLKMPKLLNTSLYLDINEHYVFHGTKSSFIENITKKGIDPRKSSDRLLFGQGIYCGESSTKADQYTDDKSHRQQKGLQMLLVRLLIGNPFVSGQEQSYKHPPCSTCKTTTCVIGEHCNYDSIIVEGRWLFREFVVYEPNQCYPEYIITYDRV
ncbi:uncharacterized protein LOC134277439 isoform X1 [Saccostrea cucullata]|uniref:uncharacterized protein LOC134277439 isoform X1 n=1 Tax=Saccostrea cuccullata TaxID=36930 RepID=UPI002ED4F9C1